MLIRSTSSASWFNSDSQDQPILPPPRWNWSRPSCAMPSRGPPVSGAGRRFSTLIHNWLKSVVLTYNQMVVDKKPPPEDEGPTDLLFGALADPIRRDVLRRAHEGRLSVSALAAEHPIRLTALPTDAAVLQR